AIAGLGELLEREGRALGDCELLVHGTTLVVNALIERKGAATALLTTKGFRDVLEIGREQRYEIDDLFIPYPRPLVPRRWRRELDERTTRDGLVLRAVDEEEAVATARELVADGVEALAVCLLHAYRSPAGERRVRDAVERELPGLAVSVSSDVAPEIREYERTSTTVANAYVRRIGERYLRLLEDSLRDGGFRGRFLLLDSSGNLIAPDTARTVPI